MAPALNFKMKSLDGKDVDLSQYKGKVVLFVNVASKCGNTPQYKGLQRTVREVRGAGAGRHRRARQRVRQAGTGHDEEIEKFCIDEVQRHVPDDVQGRGQGRRASIRCTST